MRRSIAVPLAYFFLALGVIGIILPILQGALFIAIGLILWAKHNRWAESKLIALKSKNETSKKIVETAERWVGYAEAWVCRILPFLAEPAVCKALPPPPPPAEKDPT